MKLLIRADASAEIGHGHILRMLALAQAWRKRGGHAIFCSVECPENLFQRVRKEGFEVCQLECELIGGGQDLELTKALANDLRADWVVLDGYSFDFDYQRQIRNSFVKLLVVDDFRFEQSFDADVLLNCSPIVTEEDYRCCKSKSTMNRPQLDRHSQSTFRLVFQMRIPIPRRCTDSSHKIAMRRRNSQNCDETRTAGGHDATNTIKHTGSRVPH